MGRGSISTLRHTLPLDEEEKGWTVNFTNYANLTQKFGKAGGCVGCGQCERMCPQHLPIITHLKAVSQHFGG